ncbi:hypothetical protein NEMBOFW57_004679 [Staphylotrichum longicolle]|uniref:Xylanolytic transcriptional activator regulatory domain-containing protein n=1 Tax=Staphylotrichum longicolle TaxID=669026 RepID=A0AAD4I6V6_9PEZI|nr:hypothetical protein NEMBOFW57_004679 [Staphylotrichum longicolle]
MESYFTNMTSFTLFRPGSIEPKFATMQHHSDAEALVAAMFSFSARHCDDRDECPSPSKFVHIALSKLDESVDRYGDTPPPFWLLQAGVLITFYHLTLRVRSRSWKKLGDCIRYAYDTNLHLIDANHDATSTADKSAIDIERWALLEERRRTWWAIWEMDVFASTIRRLPTAIDASLNLTMLPVPDSCWFGNKYQESCFLVEDCNLRWKYLARSGNQSAKAWFIVVNSLMRNTQRIVYYPASSVAHPQRHGSETNHNEELNVIANCLYCTVASMPARLVYQGETLDFQPKQATSQDQDQDQDQDGAVNPRQHHADKYGLHLMTQLCRFMIYHQKICTRAPWLAQQQQQHRQQERQQRNHTYANTESTAPPPPPPHPSSKTPPQQSNSEWSNYMDASAEIVALVRHSARDHHRYVNPFLVNTLWFAAAAQCACKVFGPATFSKRLAASNLDLLKLVIDRFVAFWGGMENLQGRLERIESSLQGLMVAGSGSNGGDRSALERRQHQHETQPAVAAQGSNSTDDPAIRRSATTQPGMPADDSLGVASSLQNNTAVTGGAELLQLDAPGGGLHAHAPGGWPDPSRRPAFGGSGLELYDFTQPFQVPGMAGQNFHATGAAAAAAAAVADPMDVSPFGVGGVVDGQLC